MRAHIKTDLNRTLKNGMIAITLSRTLERTGLLWKKLSKSVIQDIHKCLKCAFARNEGDKTGMEENLRAIISQQFGDHTSCHQRFCGFKLKPQENYIHRCLPYKSSLRMTILDFNLKKIFESVINGIFRIKPTVWTSVKEEKTLHRFVFFVIIVYICSLTFCVHTWII